MGLGSGTPDQAGDLLPDNKGKRLHWVDSAQGIGVILVLLGHLLYQSRFRMLLKAIYSFHVPLFFLLAGYLQRRKIGKGYLVKKAQRLLVPFLVYTALGLFYFGRKSLLKGKIVKVMLNSFYVKGKMTNSPLWFLIVLFEIYLVNYILKLSNRHIAWQVAAFAAAFIAGDLLYKYKKIKLLSYFGWNRAVICLAFFAAGLLLQKIPFEQFGWLKNGAIIAATLAVWYWAGVKNNSHVSVYRFKFGNYNHFFVAAITGSIALMLICLICINRECFLTKLSNYAILFLGSQYFVLVPFKKFIKRAGLAKTRKYDLIAFLLLLAFITLVPVIYEALKKKIPVVKLLNGERL